MRVAKRNFRVLVVAGILFGTPDVRAADCSEDFPALIQREKTACLNSWRSKASRSTRQIEVLSELLAKADSSLSEPLLVAALDAIRAACPPAKELSDQLAGLLPHQARIYRGRDRLDIVYIRAYIFVVLGEIKVSPKVQPFLLESISNIDERISPVEVGAAARALGSLGSYGRPFVPRLLATLTKRFAEEEFSLERFGVVFPRQEATTVQIEVLRALGRICTREDKDAIDRLRRYAEKPVSGNDPRLAIEAREALKAIFSNGEGGNGKAGVGRC